MHDSVSASATPGGRRHRPASISHSPLTEERLLCSQWSSTQTTGGSNLILHRKLKYSMCFLTDVIVKIEKTRSNRIQKTSISGVKFSWTSLSLIRSPFSDEPPNQVEQLVVERYDHLLHPVDHVLNGLKLGGHPLHGILWIMVPRVESNVPQMTVMIGTERGRLGQAWGGLDILDQYENRQSILKCVRRCC